MITEGTTSVRGLLTVSYGLVAYAAFLVVVGWAVAFVENTHLTVGGAALLPSTLDGSGDAAIGTAVVVDLALLTLFAMQHSVMARQGFKRWWRRFVPSQVERSTYVLLATVCLAALLLWWRPIDAVVWDVPWSWLRVLLVGASLAGWTLVLLSTFLIDHWDLFGVRQVLLAARGRQPAAYRFATPMCYCWVRHPIYLGFLIAFWSAPTLTAGHLLFALGTTSYVLVGIRWEERDLVVAFGDDYRTYRAQVPRLLPRRVCRRVSTRR